MLRCALVALVGCGGLAACGDDEPKGAPPVVIADGNNTTAGNGETGPNNGSRGNGGMTTGGGTNNTGGASEIFVLDLRVDTNRDGVVDLEGDSDETGEDDWNAEHGAVMLANIDDDDSSCPRRGSDSELARCNDASEEGLDGANDLLDMATIQLMPSVAVPDDAVVEVLIELPGSDRSRLFVDDEGWREWNPAEDVLDAAALEEGVTFKIEGTDVPRDDRWNGDVRVVATARGSFTEDATLDDAVTLRIAPLVLRHHLDPVVSVYSSELGIGGDGAFTNDLERHVDSRGVENGRFELPVEDQWTQDYFETAYMAMPTENGLHVINVWIRSANVEQDFFTGQTQQRASGRVVFTAFRGPDQAGFAAVDFDHNMRWDTLDSFGNTETIPPYPGWPVGRIIRGTGDGVKGDGAMISVFEQGVQSPFYVDTGWLMVSHIDETVSFIRNDDSPLGWSLIANDAAWAVQMMRDIRDDGRGQTTMFDDKYWLDFNSNRAYSARASVEEVLNNPIVMGSSAEAVIEIDEQVTAILAETGLPEDQIVPIPFLHMEVDGQSVAYQPGIVNGVVLDDTTFVAPTPHGPVVDGQDVLVKATEDEFAKIGVSVLWNEDWDMYHRLSGEVHCGSNVRRAVPDDAKWWGAAQ
jgi:protein-arginine deiminase